MKKLTLRLSDEMNDALVDLAQAHQRSVNKQLVWLIEQELKRETIHKSIPKAPQPPKQPHTKGRSPERPDAEKKRSR